MKNHRAIIAVKVVVAGGDDPPAVDPIIAGLLKRLPKSGAEWPEGERKLWLQLLEGNFKLIYIYPDSSIIRKTACHGAIFGFVMGHDLRRLFVSR
jgi:hypothetical protein